MNMVYSPVAEGSTPAVPPIPGKYVSWPDANLQSTPPPPPPPPLLSAAYPMIPKASGPASVA